MRHHKCSLIFFAGLEDRMMVSHEKKNTHRGHSARYIAVFCSNFTVNWEKVCGDLFAWSFPVNCFGTTKNTRRQSKDKYTRHTEMKFSGIAISQLSDKQIAAISSTHTHKHPLTPTHTHTHIHEHKLKHKHKYTSTNKTEGQRRQVYTNKAIKGKPSRTELKTFPARCHLLGCV